jgi:hypothetical protein
MSSIERAQKGTTPAIVVHGRGGVKDRSSGRQKAEPQVAISLPRALQAQEEDFRCQRYIKYNVCDFLMLLIRTAARWTN